VLGGGTNDYTTDYENRLWFEPQAADVERRAKNNPVLPDGGVPNFLWEPNESYWDCPFPITGLGSVRDTLLVFSKRNVMAMTGDTPPSISNGPGNMVLQPFLNVGCWDAHSIVSANEGLIFAGEEGVWWTNGASVQSLTEKSNGTGIQSYWRSLFPRFEYANHTTRQLIGGMINKDYYIICVLDNGSPPVNIVTLMCHVPTASWVKVSNFSVNCMAPGYDEENISELYMAESNTNYISRASRMVYPSAINMNDGNGVPIQPTYTTRNLTPAPGMKSYGYGWISYSLNLSQGALAGWAATTSYALNSLIYVTYARSTFGDNAVAVFKATTGGTSGSTQPDWRTAATHGTTVSDGGVVWTNQGPTLTVKGMKDLGRWGSTDNQEMAATGNDSSKFVVRKRFKVFTDTQALWLQITQNGYSSQTGIQLIELEQRGYWPTADSIGR
jgi:hypothetical protein